MSSLHKFTALLICTENSFWNRSTSDGDFTDRFKKSFSLYVTSGTKKKIEDDVDMLINEHGEYLDNDTFKEKLHIIIKGHYLPHPGT